MYPRGFPKVCSTLDHFLVAKFPNEYALRKDTIQFKQASCKHEGPSTCSMEPSKRDISPVLLPSEVKPHRYTHVGAGSDACGMCPIVGDRYRCKDCTEKMGFDLCGDFYKTRPMLPGRHYTRKYLQENNLALQFEIDSIEDEDEDEDGDGDAVALLVG
ncbi:Proteolysis 1, putative isoform 2 [Hibiscus syriacus]|uniref:Proteolysis 1, putative isoform 2 n=1 Tax=Hibiscus syriacus TaxID=106335 RepID=A0A6A2YA19_HIBSY|nr:Proteolysis 1, putative isoform 2 [Hibiscus syriacus]